LLRNLKPALSLTRIEALNHDIPDFQDESKEKISNNEKQQYRAERRMAAQRSLQIPATSTGSGHGNSLEALSQHPLQMQVRLQSMAFSDF
jgi:hypothetical protein